MRHPLNPHARIPVLGLLICCSAVFTAAAGGAQPMDDFSDFNPEKWVINRNMDFATSKDENGNERRVLIMKRGMKQIAYIRDYRFTDGTIEFEFKGGRWVGLAFRVRDEGKTAEIFYFRNPKVEGWERSIRYYARDKQEITEKNKNGQIEGHDIESGTIPLPRTVSKENRERLLDSNDWVKVKCVVAGAKATIYLGDSAKPVFEIDKLAFPGQAGTVGVYGWDGAFANYKVSPTL